MIATIIIVSLAMTWLGYESDWMRVRLLVGEPVKPKYARYKAYNMLRKGKPRWNDSPIYEGNNYLEGYSPNGEPEYIVVLNPGITDVLCGWEWLDKHCASMVDYQPKIYLDLDGVRYNMTIKKSSALNEVMKANHLTRKQQIAYAQV